MSKTNHIPVPHVDPMSDRKGLGWWEFKDRILMRCPNGHVAFLGDHEIASDGTVSPSVQCPGAEVSKGKAVGCTFHKFVVLSDYTIRSAGKNWKPSPPPLIGEGE